VQGRIACAGSEWLDTRRGIELPPELRRCGYVFQDYALFPHLSARSNVAFGIRQGSRARRRGRAEALLAELGLGDRLEARPATLSGGERQRVALARALAAEPAALLLDEPLSALDAVSRGSAARTLAAILAEAGVATLLVTHDFAEAATFGDEIAVMDAGRIVQRGTAGELAATPGSAFVAEIAGASVLRGEASQAERGLTRIELEGSGAIFSTDPLSGPVAASVFPWEVELGPRAEAHGGSARNQLAATVTTVTELGNRVRVGLTVGLGEDRGAGAAPAAQPLSAEVTLGSVDRLGLRPGLEVTASWKATATRLSRL